MSVTEELVLPEQVNILLICPDILLLRGIIPEWRNDLIALSEKIKLWRQSGQVNHGVSNDSYKSEFRTSRSFMISHHQPLFGPALTRYENALLRAFHTGAKAYVDYNPHLNVTDDSGYELLRYREGERFGLHTDAILGRNEGFRQVSGLLYLNDNYSGGETYFPRQGVKFKGQAGDLLLFPSNFCYPHESLPVTQGTKYAVVTWFIAYPKKPSEEGSHDEAEDGSDDAGSGADDGVRLYGSAGGGPVAGEPQAPDREHPACVGGRTEPGAEA